jgi:hypothetical protein
MISTLTYGAVALSSIIIFVVQIAISDDKINDGSNF